MTAVTVLTVTAIPRPLLGLSTTDTDQSMQYCIGHSGNCIDMGALVVKFDRVTWLFWELMTYDMT